MHKLYINTLYSTKCKSTPCSKECNRVHSDWRHPPLRGMMRMMSCRLRCPVVWVSTLTGKRCTSASSDKDWRSMKKKGAAHPAGDVVCLDCLSILSKVQSAVSSAWYKHWDVIRLIKHWDVQGWKVCLALGRLDAGRLVLVLGCFTLVIVDDSCCSPRDWVWLPCAAGCWHLLLLASLLKAQWFWSGLQRLPLLPWGTSRCLPWPYLHGLAWPSCCPTWLTPTFRSSWRWSMPFPWFLWQCVLTSAHLFLKYEQSGHPDRSSIAWPLFRWMQRVLCRLGKSSLHTTHHSYSLLLTPFKGILYLLESLLSKLVWI